MELLDILHQVVSWSVVAINAVALFAAVSWPRVRGKAWLVAFLSITLAQGLYFQVFYAVVRYTADQPRYELYKEFEKLSFLVSFSGVVAHFCLVVALFHLRSFLNASGLTSSFGSPHVPVSTPPARASWPAKGGTFIGAYRVNGSGTAALAGDVTLSLLEDDSLIISGKYDPPGSLFYAFLATIASGVVAAVMLSALGFAAAPGWLLWYIIIVLIRRRKFAINLANAESIVVDPATSRIAVRTTIEGRDRWFGIQLLSDFQSATKALTAAFPEKVMEGTVAGPSALPIVLLVTVIVAVIAVIISFAVQ